GESAKAIEDLQAATQAGAPAVATKARAALEEARRRAGGKAAPSENEPEQLLAKLGELTPRAAGGDASAEKDAATLARGLAVRGGVRGVAHDVSHALPARRRRPRGAVPPGGTTALPWRLRPRRGGVRPRSHRTVRTARSSRRPRMPGRRPRRGQGIGGAAAAR